MKKFVCLFLLLMTIGHIVNAQDITFKATAPEAVVKGEQFRLVYTINAEARASELRVADMSDFDVLIGPTPSTSQSMMFVNGVSTREITSSFTYILMAKNEGTFTIPEATIRAKNANYKSNPVTIKVLPPDQAKEAQSNQSRPANGLGENDLFMRMFVSKTNVYEQEGFQVTFKLYTKNNNISNIFNVKFPEFEGFLVQELEMDPNLKLGMERYNDQNYLSAVIKQYVLYPQRSGKITIESGKMDVEVRLRMQSSGRPSIFDDFFDNYQNVKKSLTTSPVTVDVKSLPQKPAGFSGAVGDFTMKTAINSTDVKANEAVTIKIDISGTGNIRLAKNPEVIFPNDFDVFDPTVSNNIRTTTAGTTGTKTIEYMAIPRYGGEFEIPAIKFIYFDLKTESYKTLSSEAYKLTVERGEGGDSNSPVVSNFTNRENVRYLGQDIRYLKMSNIRFLSKEEMFFGSFLYLMCYLIPALLFAIFFVLYRKQIQENANIALVRTKKANKMAVRRLKIAGKLMRNNQKEEFYDEVLRALWGYLSDKLNILQANLTKDNVENELLKYGVEESLINEFMHILNTCEFARYAPSQADDAMDKLYEMTVDAIGKMENTIKK